MQVEIKDFTRETLADAQAIAAKMFTRPVGDLIEHFLENPVNKVYGCDSYGEIAYQDGMPVAFRAAILKRLYLGQQPLLGVVGSTFCSDKSTSPVVLMKLLKKNVGSRAGSRFFFTNTSCEASMKLNKLVGVKSVGPKSCEKISYSVLRFGSFVRMATRGKLPKFLAWMFDVLAKPFLYGFCVIPWRKNSKVQVATAIDEKAYERFWDAYLAKNQGLVCSRTAMELKWAYDRFLKDNTLALLEYREKDAIVGYVVAKETSVGRWMVYDWIALENDAKKLLDLMRSLVAYLGRYRKAVLIEAIGYPEFIQGVLHKVLPFTRKTSYNTVAYGLQDKTFTEELNKNLESSWFFGAYDGDRYLG